MSEIKSAGIKGYVVLGAFIALLLFVVLVVYIYKGNQERVPADPLLYGYLRTAATTVLRA